MSKRSFQVSIDFLGNISDLQNKIKTLSGDLSKIGATSGGVNVQKQFDQLAQSLQNLQTKAKQPITSQGEFNRLMQEVNKVEGSYNNLLATLEGLYNLSNSKKLELLPKEEQQRIRQAAQAIKIFESNTKSASSSIKELKNAQDKANNALDNQAAAQKTFKSLTAQAAAAEKEYKDLATAANNLADAQEKYNNLFYKTGKRAGQQKDNISNEQVAEATAKLTEAKTKADMLRGAYDNIGTAAAEAGKRAQTLSNLKIKASQELTKAQEAVNRLNKELEELKVKFEASSGQQLQQSFEQLKNKAKELEISLEGIGDKATTSGIDLLKQRLQSLETQGLERVDQGIAKTIATTQGGLLPALQNVRLEADKSRDSFDGFTRAMNDVEGLKSRIGYFFSMTNSVMLLRRALTSALNTVKELDAVMTETAVVTDFTVGDMWEKLPEYASHANALGASIKDLYSATTLYYQQGLQTEAAMGVGIETMKMARIAGMEAADATEAMTAALRGFNMEVNETNAVRVNDVYSELAAITAADTEQIATAMSKTASIAASANMEFETTAALLAQIIETTQEAPETAGTALKTIIARFSEVKKLREEGANTGEDEEGEAIDVNKIQGALRTVGISMDDFFAGAEGLDSILLKLAEKWSTLDFETQRYIATTAAGSRQQSRFIAMMSDYERTMELATAANNSAGASQQQFDKTLESMEAKLQKLKNAWNEFTMGLANNEILKLGVDLLTGLLNAVNKVTSSLSGGNGLVKSIINLATVIGALKGGASIFKGIFGESGLLKNKSTGLLTSIIGKDSTSKAGIQGQKDGLAYANGFSGAIQSKKTGVSMGQQFGALIGKEAVVSIGSMTEEQLDESISKLKTRTPNATVKNTTTGVTYKSYKVQDITADQAVELKNTLKDFDAGKITYDEADAACQKYGTSMKELTKTVQTTALDFTSLGMAAVGVGTAFTLLGGLADKLGNKKISEILRNIGSALTGIGSVAMMLGPVLTKLGIGFTKLGIAINGSVVVPMTTLLGTVLPLVLALGALVAIFIAIRNASPEAQLKKAQEAAQQASEAADKAAEAYDNLNSSLESIEGKEAALENLAIGTLEWKEAVTELNNEILDLIDIYPELAKFVEPKDGVLSLSEKTIDGETVESILSSYQQAEINAQSAKVASLIDVQEKQQIVDFDNLKDEYKVVIKPEYDVQKINYSEAGVSATWLEQHQMDYYSPAPEQEQMPVYDQEGTIELAKAIASGNWEGMGDQIEELGGVDSEAFEGLREFGQSLIASEAAIDAYSQSILNNAAINSDLSEEQKKQLQGMIDSEGILKLVENEEDELSKLDTNTLKSQFAEVMNYMYDETTGKIYSGYGEDRKEVIMNEKEIREQLAAIKVQEQLTGNMTKLSSVLKTLKTSTNLMDKAFGRVVSKADGAALTLEDLNNVKIKESLEAGYEESIEKDEATGEFKEFQDDQLQSLYDKVKHIYPPDEFFRIFSEAYGEASKRMDQATNKLSSIGLKNSFKNVKIDTGALSNLADNLYNVFLSSGSEKTAELASRLEGILDSIKDPEQAQIFADALNSIDWKDIDSVKGLSDLLEGMDFNVPIGDIGNLEDEIISAAKAAKNFSLEEVRNQLKSLGDLKKDLEGRDETERSFTTEQRDAYVGMNEDLAEDFVMVGPDEWVYIGESMASLEAAIRENTSAILGETTENLRGKAEASQNWIELMNSEKTYSGKQVSIQQHGINGELVISEAFVGTFEEAITGILNGTIKDQSLLKEVLTALGENTEGNITELVERISSLFSEQYGLNGSVANTNVAQYQDWKNSEEQQKYTNMGGKELLDVVINKNSTPEQIEMANKALAAQAMQLNITSEEIEYYKKLLAETGEVTGDLDAAATEMATRIRKQQIAINEASEEIGGYLTTMDEAEEGSNEYLTAISKIPAQIEKAFGFKPDLTWVQDNLNLIRQWAAGSEEAGEQIFNSLYNNVLAAMNGSQAEVAAACLNMVDWLNWFSGTEVWASAGLNNQGFMEALTDSASAAEEFAAFLASQGFDTELIETGSEPIRVPVTSLSGSNEGQIIDWQEIPVPKYKVTWKASGTPNPFSGGNYSAPSNYTPKSGGGGGGGGGGSESTKWENPYDEFYNTVQKLNEELRKRNKLEREYQRLLDKTNTTGKDLTENAEKQLASLEIEKKTREELLKNRERQMDDIEEENSQYSEYAHYNEKLGIIEIDWEKIETLDGSTDEEFTKGLEEYISQLEDQEKLIEEEEDALDEIEDTIKEIRDQGKDEYFDFENQIRDALEQSRQEEIDKLNAINESINDTNTRLLDAMQSSIDKYRQDRENERTEEELSDKQRRLAYLQQDTSGANDLEILQLQEEIDQGTEDYTDTLIDQKINELQEQNDKAAEQRQQQIDLLQAQLDQYLDSGEVWQDVYKLLDDGFDEKGVKPGSDLERLLMEGASFKSLSELAKMKWLEELENTVAKAYQWLTVGNSTESLLDRGELKKGQKISFTTADGKKVTGTLDAKGNVTTKSGEKYKGVYRTYNGAFVTDENYITPDPPKPAEPSKKDTEIPKLDTNTKRGVSAAIWNGGYGWGNDPYRSGRLEEVFGKNDIQENYVEKYVMSGYTGKISDYSYENMKKKFKKFKTGGLADFTGPAWLDGTKSKPEYILNADQTKSFFQLVDVLGSLKSGASQSSQITGDSIYDVDINVESIGSDYDVEQLASTIKRMINDDARYRNNNAINLQR